jgi:hypothetical protein
LSVNRNQPSSLSSFIGFLRQAELMLSSSISEFSLFRSYRAVLLYDAKQHS